MTIRRAQGADYERIAVRTHLIHIKEPLEPVFDEYVKPVLQPGDWLAVSEKFVTISQGRVIHHSVVRPGVLAKLLVKGVTKHPDDVGYSDPRKMQVAIMQAGWWRMLFAMIIACFWNPLAGRTLFVPLQFLALRREPLYQAIGELRPIDWSINWQNGLPLLMLGWALLQIWRWRRGRPTWRGSRWGSGRAARPAGRSWRRGASTGGRW